ncbi:MAG: hypothetical protein ABH864_05020 [archaeon]
MLLRILGALGIGECPYTAKCGPEAAWLSDQAEEDEARRTCYTFEHRKCPVYLAKQAEQKRKAEIIRSSAFDRY